MFFCYSKNSFPDIIIALILRREEMSNDDERNETNLMDAAEDTDRMKFVNRFGHGRILSLLNIRRMSRLTWSIIVAGWLDKRATQFHSSLPSSS